ncbi:MAG: transcriptional regulator [Bacilli bacterium]|nr:transcriptional regulator [Bacilli bacterium]
MAACRKRAGLTQEKLAEILHCSRSSLCKIETNNKEVKFDFFVKWAIATNSKDAGLAFVFGEKDVHLLLDQLKEGGYIDKFL